MLLKDVSRLIAIDVNVILYTRIKYSEWMIISFHTGTIPSFEFKHVVETTDALASKTVEKLTVNDGNFCVCISDVSRGDIVE